MKEINKTKKTLKNNHRGAESTKKILIFFFANLNKVLFQHKERKRNAKFAKY